MARALQSLIVLWEIVLEYVAQIFVVVRRYTVIRSNIDRAIRAELVGFQAVLNLGAFGSLKVIFKTPGNLIAAHEQGPRLYIETDPSLE